LPRHTTLIINYYVCLGSSLISWKSKKQTNISRSASEVEYRVLTTATCEIQWITYLLKDLRVDRIITVALYYTN